MSWTLGPVAALLGHTLLRTSLVAVALGHWLRGLGLSTWLSVAIPAMVLVSPFTHGALLSGVPEGLTVLLAAPFAWALGRFMVGQGRPWLPLVLGLFCALDGVYAAVAAAVLGTCQAGMTAWRAPSPRLALLRGALVGGPAAAAFLGLMAAQAQRGHRALHSGADLASMTVSDRWMAAPMGGIDLLGLVAWQSWLPEAPMGLAHRHLGYVGVPLLIGVLLAAWRSPQARWLSLLAAGVLLLALGDRARLAGMPLVSWPLPGAVLVNQGGQNIYRLAGLALLLGLAALGVGLPRRWLAPAMVVVGADLLMAAPLRLPTVPNPAGAVEAWLAEGVGAVLDLPLEDDRPESPLARPHRSLFLQANHGRPIASALLRTSQVLERGISPVTRFQEAVLQVSAGVPAPLPAVKRAEGDQALAELQELGFTAVSLDLGRIPKQMRDRAGNYLVTWLGPPDVESPGRLAWTLPEP